MTLDKTRNVHRFVVHDRPEEAFAEYNDMLNSFVLKNGEWGLSHGATAVQYRKLAKTMLRREEKAIQDWPDSCLYLVCSDCFLSPQQRALQSTQDA